MGAQTGRVQGEAEVDHAGSGAGAGLYCQPGRGQGLGPGGVQSEQCGAGVSGGPVLCGAGVYGVGVFVEVAVEEGDENVCRVFGTAASYASAASAPHSEMIS